MGWVYVQYSDVDVHKILMRAGERWRDREELNLQRDRNNLKADVRGEVAAGTPERDVEGRKYF